MFTKSGREKSVEFLCERQLYFVYVRSCEVSTKQLHRAVFLSYNLKEAYGLAYNHPLISN